ncbi:MAG: class I SAM-dependent methyltransferase [Chthoniobacterales bacterium]
MTSLSFASFMQKALYDPEHGYYASGRVRIGRQGDFFTNVSVGNIYGKILALFFQDLWEKLGKPKPFSIVEQGAHDGTLALDILEALQASPEIFDATHYYIVEPFLLHQHAQQEKLEYFKNISWVTQLSELPEFEGIHFSNELIDAFPVHLLTWNREEWLEKRVIQTGEHAFSWITAPIEEKELDTVAASLPRSLAPGFLWEVRLGIAPWLTKIASRMKRGMILIADYGYAAPQRFAPYRAEGSIACYYEHRRYDNPLEEPGKRDITAHVDFTALAETARQLAWSLLGFSDQHHFLIGVSEEWLRTFEGKPPNAGTQRDFRRLQTLLHPETMGRQFQFLGLGKEMTATPVLNGFRYERPGLASLG